MKKNLKILFFGWFTIMPIIILPTDVIMSVVDPNINWIAKRRDIDVSIFCQSLFLSVWSLFVTFFWALLNFIDVFNRKMPPIIKNKNLFTLVFSLNLVVFLTFIVPFLMNPSKTTGFDKWYGISKSVCEHFISPIILIIFYFFNIFEIERTKKYFIKYSWYNLIIPITYLSYIMIRWALKVNYFIGNDSGDEVPFFPYENQINPSNASIVYQIFAALALIVAPFAVAILMNYLSNLTSKRNLRLKETSKFYQFFYEDKNLLKV